jgi:dipeptidyl aminopeptidase/acylaminoacyl peptidase
MANRYNFCLLLIVLTNYAFSQFGESLNSNNSGPHGLERWKLNKYLWSAGRLEKGAFNKLAIDFDVIENWQEIGKYLAVSSDGHFLAYAVENVNQSVGAYRKIDSLVVQSLNSSFRLSLPNCRPGGFTDDNELYIFQDGMSLGIMQLENFHISYIRDVKSYKLAEQAGEAWIAYQLNSKESEVRLRNLKTKKEKRFTDLSSFQFNSNGWFICLGTQEKNIGSSRNLTLYELTTGKEKRFESINDYLFAPSSQSLILSIAEKIQQDTINSLEYISVLDWKRTKIWSAKKSEKKVDGYNVDKSGDQVVFTAANSDGTNKVVWYYKKNMDEAVVKVAKVNSAIPEDITIYGSPFFSNNGKYILFSFQYNQEVKEVDPDAIQVEVWNHKDLKIQSIQSNESNNLQVFVAVVNLQTDSIIQLGEQSRLRLWNEVALNINSAKDTYGDRFWESTDGLDDGDSAWLISFKDGHKQSLPITGRIETFWMSPGGNYLLCFDLQTGHYYSYDFRYETYTDICQDKHEMQMNYKDPFNLSSEKPKQPCGIAAWLEGDEEVLVYDNNDIWILDLTGSKSPVNLTNGFGKSHGIIFRLFKNQGLNAKPSIVKMNQALVLRTFDTSNKQSGFYKKVIGKSGNPELLSMGNYFIDMFEGYHDPNLSNDGMTPIKAKTNDVWIIHRESFSDAPNYYKTKDFKSFQKLTNYQPQNRYNWLTQELVSFEHLDGKKGHAILYKPENFDPSKKYPVLIVCYGAFSNNFNQFRDPSLNIYAISPGESPIWFLKNGYLVFAPDIYVTPLKYGPQAFNVIEGAARYLNSLSYVKTGRLGCASHSWSAKLGAYVFTHSKSFAATVISEGFVYANMINVALSINEDGTSKLNEVENDFQFGTLWENKASWLDQTTVFNVDKVVSPLLLLCNKNSSKEYQNQTVQLFTSLRRLGKNVWWLKYDKGSHTLRDQNEQKDYTVRYTQYFDHYLKDAPAPRWMTQGVPAAMKGIDMAYELDPSGTCALDSKKDCEICKKWNEQYRRTPEMFTKPIAEWQLDADLANELKTKNQNQESTTHAEK